MCANVNNCCVETDVLGEKVLLRFQKEKTHPNKSLLSCSLLKAPSEHCVWVPLFLGN